MTLYMYWPYLCILEDTLHVTMLILVCGSIAESISLPPPLTCTHTVCRIVRVIRQPRGNMLLVGVGGSGRQSLSRLAAYILEYSVFQIEVTRHYRLQEFREDLRQLYYQAGVENKPSVFLFTDTQVVEESFLEDINNIFSSGEVPNLYKPDEFEEVRTVQ